MIAVIAAFIVAVFTDAMFFFCFYIILIMLTVPLLSVKWVVLELYIFYVGHPYQLQR